MNNYIEIMSHFFHKRLANMHGEYKYSGCKGDKDRYVNPQILKINV